MSDKQTTKEELLEKLEAARIKFQNLSLPPELYEVLTEGIAFAEKHFVGLQDENADLKRQLGQYSPLKQPSDTAREVFAVTAEKEGADMRAVPNQWVLNERALAGEAVTDLERQLAEAQQNAAFFKCCALSGEVPKDGAEPSPPTAEQMESKDE